MIFTFSFSGHVNRSDKKASEMPRLVANFHQLVMTECKISQPSKSITTDKSPQREVNQERRSSFPFNSPQKEQHYGALLHSTSEARLSIMDQNRQLQLGKLLMVNVGKGVFSNLGLFQNILCTVPLVE